MFRRCHLHPPNSFASQYVSTWSLENIGTISFFQAPLVQNLPDWSAYLLPSLTSPRGTTSNETVWGSYSLTSRKIFDILTACQKTFLITKKLNLPSFSNNLLEDFSISEYVKIVLIMMVKKPHVALNNTSFCPHHVPDNFITFHFRAPGRHHIVSVPFEAMEIPCLVNEHCESSCPLQS